MCISLWQPPVLLLPLFFCFFGGVFVATQHLLCRDGALTPQSAFWSLAVVGCRVWRADTCSLLLSHHGPALPRQHAAYHPYSSLEIWHHPHILNARIRDELVAGASLKGRGTLWYRRTKWVIKGLELITRKIGLLCFLFFLFFFQLTALHVYSGKSYSWPGGGARCYWFHIGFISLNLLLLWMFYKLVARVTECPHT